MGSDEFRRHRLVDRCCNGVCFGIGFVVTLITLITMFWLVWFYFGLTIVQVSNTQRRALVDYSYVPPSTSSPNQNTPSEVPESSLNQISKLATVSSSFPRVDPTEVLEKKREILNGRSSSLAKGDFAARPRSNKTGDIDESRTALNREAEKKPNDEEDVSQRSPSSPNEKNEDKSIEKNHRNTTGIQHDKRRNISSSSKSRIIPTEVNNSEFANEKTTHLNQSGSTREEIPPITVVNSRLPEDDLASRNPNFENRRELLPGNNNRDRGFDDRADSVRDNDRSEDDKMPKGDSRVIRPPSQEDVRLRDRDSDRDDRYRNLNTRRRWDVDKYDDREDRYRDRIPYDDRHVEDRKREDDSYGPTRDNRNRDRIVEEDRSVDDRRDRRRGDEGKYDDKSFEDRYRDRITVQRYPDKREEDSDRYDDRDRRINRDRSRVSSDDEYFEKYPNEERKSRDDFQDRRVREHRYQDRQTDEKRRLYRDEERSRDVAERFDERYPTERGNDKIPESRYRDESRRRYDDDRVEDYDRRKLTKDDEYRYRDRFRDDVVQPSRTRSRTDDRYNYRDEAVDSSRYDSKEDHYRPETRGSGRDSIQSSRTDYGPTLEGIKYTRQTESTINDRRYLSSGSRSYVEDDTSDLKRDVGIENRDRKIFKDDDLDKFPRLDGRDRIAPTRVKDDRYITREPDEDAYAYERRVDGSYQNNRRPTIIDTKYQDDDDRSRTPTSTRIESSRVSPSGRREYYASDEIKQPSKLGNDEISLERRSYSPEDDEYRLSNANSRSRPNQPISTPYDDRRRDYRSDDPNKKYTDDDDYERSRRTNVRSRDSTLRDDGVRYDKDGNKEDRYRDASSRDRFDRDGPINRDERRDRDGPINRNERNREQDEYNRKRDKFEDPKYEDDRYDRNRDRYDDRYEEDRYDRNRDRYDYRYAEDRYDRNRDRFVEDRHGEERYDRTRDRYDESRYDRDRDRYDDGAEYKESSLDRNRSKYNDDRYGDRYDNPSELKPSDTLPIREDRDGSRDFSGTRLRNTSPPRSDERKEGFLPPSDGSKRPFHSDVDDRGLSSKDTRLRESSFSSISDYDADRPLSAKDVIDAALRQAESTDLVPKKVFYPVFDPRISNLTSSDIIRPSERRGITINSRRRRKRKTYVD
uniref:Uncharacterized protein n=1 Tax=Parasteatoda tepidariorum TaxID=114398 RepID=A0A2L2XZ15_PARTP